MMKDFNQSRNYEELLHQRIVIVFESCESIERFNHFMTNCVCLFIIPEYGILKLELKFYLALDTAYIELAVNTSK